MTGTGAHGVRPSLFAPLGATGLPVAFLHAALPTRRPSFVPAGQGLGWSRGETGAVAAPAGLGHVAVTGPPGGPAVRPGIEASRWTEGVFPHLVGGAPVAVGSHLHAGFPRAMVAPEPRARCRLPRWPEAQAAGSRHAAWWWACRAGRPPAGAGEQGLETACVRRVQGLSAR